ncbi:pilus assembly protein TadG-related protein [Angustibacter aerolatus]
MTARTARREEGQITLPLLVLVLVLFACALGMFGFGEASDSRGKAQKAADASALAAAKYARDGMLAVVVVNGATFHGQWSALGSAVSAAACPAGAAYAEQNTASLTSCRYDPSQGTVTTGTRSKATAARHQQGTATAKADLHLPRCTLSYYTSSGYDHHEVVTCTASRGGTASVDYLNTAGYTVFQTSTLKQWQQVFRIRLVDDSGPF